MEIDRLCARSSVQTENGEYFSVFLHLLDLYLGLSSIFQTSHLLKLRVDEYALEKLSYPLCKYLEFEQVRSKIAQ